jgi:hypothetical protein
MRHTTRTFIEACLATSLLAGGITGCSSTTSEDIAYEDAYAGDYYYPADVAVAGAYGVGWGYGLYYAPSPDGGTGGGGHSGSLPVGASIREAIGNAIRVAASGGDVCGGNAVFTRGSAGAGSVCGIQTNGFNLTFNSCKLSGGGTIDGTVAVALNISAGDTNCISSTTLNVGYTSTVTNLTYTGGAGSKIVIPSQTDTASIQTTLGAPPATISMMSTGEIQRVGSNGTVNSDRTYTGNRTFSSISFANQTYTIDGSINVTDKTGGGTGVVSSMGLKREPGCCKPTGGTLSVNRMGGNHSGSHSWTFSSSCGQATFDGKTVTLPACL